MIGEIFRTGINPLGEPGAWLFRRDDFDRIGGFNAELAGTVDIDLATRLLLHGDLYGLPEPLAVFRVQGNSYTARWVGAQVAELRGLLRRLAADRRWSVSRRRLWWALAASRLEAVKRLLLYRASDDRLPLGRPLLAAWSRYTAGAATPSSEPTGAERV